jgi:sigma-B regulation protein RsbU (phosphoserine phosphatase)
MIAAPIPLNEAERLTELQALKILDTPSEARFDRIVELAAHVFRVPIAYVAMVDANRQWFKSRKGLEVAENPRGVSFCSHTILQDGPLVIDDALLDPRFCDSPLVLGEPFVRFYAGHPLKAPGGSKVGTLCLADHTPRTLTDSDLEVLKRLAAMAEHELGMVSLIRSQRELLETKTQLIEAQTHLAHELSEAAEYVKSLLPQPLNGSIRSNWQFVSSSALGGDFFGHRWLNENCLAIFLLDVMGHGVGAALLSTSVESVLRGGPIANIALDDPAAVIKTLNLAFPMEENDQRFFSMWYGVYDRRDRSLTYTNAGHPPALLVHGHKSSSPTIHRLGATGTMVGAIPDSHFTSRRIAVPHHSRLYLYSDGAYELTTPDGGMLAIEDMEAMIARVSSSDTPQTAEILRLIRAAHGHAEFQDDVSLLEVAFD